MGYFRILVFLWSFSFSFSVFAQNDISKKVLFVGNSYTYFWNLPQTLELMSDAGQAGLVCRQSTSGGASLGHHWRGDKNLKSRSEIKNGSYNIVVLQDHSMRAIDHPDSLLLFGELLNKEISESGAEVYLYQTWARERTPLTQATITKGYNELANKIGAKVVPVGETWKLVREKHPDLKLFTEDGSHPSTIGTYLTACVFYRTITKKSALGLPFRLSTTDKNGQKFYVSIMSKENATYCQQAADLVVSQIEAE